MDKDNSLHISAKSFITAAAVIFLFMLGSYALTFVIPGGSYTRVINESGDLVIDAQAGFQTVQGGLPFWKWILSPFLVLGTAGGGSLIAIILFLLVIGGVSNALTESGLMHHMLDALVNRYGAVRYRLMAILLFFSMAAGTLVGPVVPLIPIFVTLSLGFGWDAQTGLSMSLLAAGCGFAAGVVNPSTVGVAQHLAGLPMFSGVWLRLLAFVCIYGLLFLYTYRHARKVSGGFTPMPAQTAYVPDRRMHTALRVFGVLLGMGLALVLCSGLIPALRNSTILIVALMFLVAGISAVLTAGVGMGQLCRSFFKGVLTVSPSILMILMASSINYTMVEGKILDTLLYYAVQAAGNMPRAGLVLFIYLICLVLNFFIPSGPAKALLLIPLIVPLAHLFGVSSQLCILAFAFGDGFSNVFYPTNPMLLISLGLADVSYGAWVAWSWRFQALNLLLTSGLLLFGLAVGY